MLVGDIFSETANQKKDKIAARLDEEKIKVMTGGDKQVARYLYGELFEFYPEFKIVLVTNHKPRIKGTDNGIWRRVLLVPFQYTVPTTKQDKYLEQKLKEEAKGILRWMVEGYSKWRDDGLQIPDSIRAFTEDYRTEEDNLGAFLDETIVTEKKQEIMASKLYHKYIEWCSSTGDYQIDNRLFAKRMEERGYKKKRKGKGYYWLDINYKNNY